MSFANSGQKNPDFATGENYFFRTDEDFSGIFSEFLSDNTSANLVVECKRPVAAVLRYMLGHFEFRRAAGGVVSNPGGEKLMIFRNGRWDLPKGHVEKGETIPGAAVREVGEETGLGNIAIGKLIAKTYHIYNMDGRWILKQTSWFDMFSAYTGILVPQTDEGIEKAVWVSNDNMFRNLESSYSSLAYLGKVIKKQHAL